MIIKILSAVSILLMSATVAFSSWSTSRAIPATVTVQKNPAKIMIQWTNPGTAAAYHVYRRTIFMGDWGSPLAILGSSATGWTYSNVTLGSRYEYKIFKQPNQTTDTNQAVAIISSGIEVPAVDYRGKMILLVDQTFTAGLATELNRYISDLIGDGWQVIRHDVARTETIQNIRAIVKADYLSDPTNVKALLLFGQIPIAWSGDLTIHNNAQGVLEHGAYPCDQYYALFNDALWTDNTVNIPANTLTLGTWHSNIPGDGKFDLSFIPAGENVPLEIGRVDMRNITGLGITEIELLRNYLNKNHNYRMATMRALERAGFWDTWPDVRYTWGSSEYRSACAIYGPSQTQWYNITSQTYNASLQAQSYQYSYGAGGSNGVWLSGITQTSDLKTMTLKTIFSNMFGSFQWDWYIADHFMRASIGSTSWYLTNACAGKWDYHHMAMGDEIGVSTRYTMMIDSLDNSLNYFVDSTHQFTYRDINICLMGDPTLRAHIIAPPTNCTAANSGSAMTISWTASTDTVLGYHVYKLDQTTGKYNRITTSPVTGTSYTDNGASSGTYMVRAMNLKVSNSGSYFNLSQGAFSNGSTSIKHPANGLNQSKHGSTHLFIDLPGYSAGSIKALKLQNTSAKIFNINGRILTAMAAKSNSIHSAIAMLRYETR
jgi:hypothetical protein